MSVTMLRWNMPALQHPIALQIFWKDFLALRSTPLLRLRPNPFLIVQPTPVLSTVSRSENRGRNRLAWAEKLANLPPPLHTYQSRQIGSAPQDKTTSISKNLFRQIQNLSWRRSNSSTAPQDTQTRVWCFTCERIFKPRFKPFAAALTPAGWATSFTRKTYVIAKSNLDFKFDVTFF